MGHGSGKGAGRTAASAANKEFALHFAQVVVKPTDRLNDMVARSGLKSPSLSPASRLLLTACALWLGRVGRRREEHLASRRLLPLVAFLLLLPHGMGCKCCHAL